MNLPSPFPERKIPVDRGNRLPVRALISLVTWMLTRMAARHPALQNLLNARRVLVRERRRVMRLARRAVVNAEHSSREAVDDDLSEWNCKPQKRPVS